MSPDPTRVGGTTVQRVRGRLVRLASWLACRLPEGPLVALVGLAGDLWLRADPIRAEQGRRNLRRIATWLDAHDRGDPAVRRAAHDPRTLEALLRSASRHHARYYLEMLITPSLNPTRSGARVTLEEPAGAPSAFAETGGVIVIALHLASLEIPALVIAHRFGREAVVPMETVPDPVMQAWFEETRSHVGIRLVPIPAARSELLGVLERGGVAGIVADRDIHGGGIAAPFFGHPAPFPIGAALVAIETGAPAFVTGAHRVGVGRYRGSVVRIPTPESGSRRERITAFLAGQAAAYEDLIAQAPDQWWSCFFPIWPDLAVRRDPAPTTTPDAHPAAPEPAP